MNSPLFPHPVELTTKDAERLSPHLGNWNHLHAVLLEGMPVSDIQRLVLLELQGARRRFILMRLLMRLRKLECQRQDKELNNLLKKRRVATAEDVI